MPSGESDLLRLGAETAKEGYGYFIGNTLSTAILAIGSILIARFLGAGNYGLYTLAFVIPSLLTLLTSLGIEASLVKSTSEYLSKGRYPEIRESFEASLIFKLLIGITAAFIVYSYSDFLATRLLNRPYITDILKLSSPLILFQALFTLGINLFVGLGRASLAGKLTLLQAIVKVSTAILLILVGLGVWGAVLGHVFGYIIASLIGLVLGSLLTGHHLSSTPKNSRLPNLKILKPLILYGLPLYASTIFLVIVMQYNNIILANFVSNIEIGGYTAAINLSTAITLIITPITVVLFPTFSRIEAADKEELPRVIELALKYTFLLVTPTALFVSAFSPELVDIVYGGGFQHAWPYLSLYGALYSIYPLFTVWTTYFNGAGLPQKTMWMGLLTLLVTLPLSPLLTNLFRVAGVITSFMIANIIAVAYATHYVIKKKGFSIGGRNLAKIYFAAAVSALLPATLKPILQNPLIALSVGALIFLIIYITLLGTLKVLDNRDHTNLQRLLGDLKLVGRLIKPMLEYIKLISRQNVLNTSE